MTGCDVLQADGGTRTASITGGYVALVAALRRLIAEGTLPAPFDRASLDRLLELAAGGVLSLLQAQTLRVSKTLRVLVG